MGNRHIIDLTGQDLKPVNVDELDKVYFKNKMNVDTTVTIDDKNLLRPTGIINIRAGKTSKKRTVRMNPSGSFSFTYDASGLGIQVPRNGTIRV